MEGQQSIDLNRVRELQIDYLYQEQFLSDLKVDLQALHGVKVKRTTDTNRGYEYFICVNGNLQHLQEQQLNLESSSRNPKEKACKNKQKKNNSNSVEKKSACKYFFKFKILPKRHRSNMYRFLSFYTTHNQNCIKPHLSQQYRARKFMKSLAQAIRKITDLKRARGQQIIPKDVREIVLSQYNISDQIITEYLEHSENIKRKSNKKIANMIAKSKSQEVIPKQHLDPEQFDRLYVNTKNPLKPNAGLELKNKKNPKNKRRISRGHYKTKRTNKEQLVQLIQQQHQSFARFQPSDDDSCSIVQQNIKNKQYQRDESDNQDFDSDHQQKSRSREKYRNKKFKSSQSSDYQPIQPSEKRIHNKNRRRKNQSHAKQQKVNNKNANDQQKQKRALRSSSRILRQNQLSVSPQMNPVFRLQSQNPSPLQDYKKQSPLPKARNGQKESSSRQTTRERKKNDNQSSNSH